MNVAPLLLTALVPLLGDGVGGLRIANARATLGVWGPERTSERVLPGDSLILSFTIEGLRPDAQSGQLRYGIGLESLDAQGHTVFRQAPRERHAQPPVGGQAVAAAASLQVGIDEPAGPNTLKLSVTDFSTKQTQVETRSFEVLPRHFGIVRVLLSCDPDGRMPAIRPAAGQPLWVNFSVVDFRRDASGQPKLAAKLTARDAQGQPALASPLTGEFDAKLPEAALSIPMQFHLEPNASGTFAVEIQVTDRVTGQSDRLSFPLEIAASK